MFTRLEAPILYVADVCKAVEFYVKQLGFSFLDGGGDFVTLSLGETRIALNKAADAEGKVAGRQAIILVSDSIDGDYRAMCSLGVHMELALTNQGYGKTFIFRDPDGNKIEIVE